MRLDEIFWPFKKKEPAVKEEYDDSKVSLKAGIIPYFKHPDGIVEFLFMVSSDPKFGGPDPMISKGGVDAGENAKQAAIREGQEELGLKPSNIKSPLIVVSDETISGLENSYRMVVFACEVKNKTDFGPHHYETAYTKWMTLDQFMTHGRKSHRGIVGKAAHMVGN